MDDDLGDAKKKRKIKEGNEKDEEPERTGNATGVRNGKSLTYARTV